VRRLDCLRYQPNDAQVVRKNAAARFDRKIVRAALVVGVGRIMTKLRVELVEKLAGSVSLFRTNALLLAPQDVSAFLGRCAR
jgi:hypothetical protein